MKKTKGNLSDRFMIHVHGTERPQLVANPQTRISALGIKSGLGRGRGVYPIRQ